MALLRPKRQLYAQQSRPLAGHQGAAQPEAPDGVIVLTVIFPPDRVRLPSPKALASQHKKVRRLPRRALPSFCRHYLEGGQAYGLARRSRAIDGGDEQVISSWG